MGNFRVGTYFKNLKDGKRVKIEITEKTSDKEVNDFAKDLDEGTAKRIGVVKPVAKASKGK